MSGLWLETDSEMDRLTSIRVDLTDEPARHLSDGITATFETPGPRGRSVEVAPGKKTCQLELDWYAVEEREGDSVADAVKGVSITLSKGKLRMFKLNGRARFNLHSGLPVTVVDVTRRGLTDPVDVFADLDGRATGEVEK